MKKLVTILSLALVLVSCKQAETTNDKKQMKPQTLLATVDCSFFAPLDSLTTEEQVVWLRANQEDACDPKNDPCRVEKHTISESVFNKGVADYWGNKPVVYTGFSLSEIKSKSINHMYEDFLTFMPNATTEIITMATDKKFSADNPTCYSIPLFYSLERVYTLSGSAEFLFTRAIIDSKETIVFFISGTSHYYDFSGNPT
jgi:hypothetical protein